MIAERWATLASEVGVGTPSRGGQCRQAGAAAVNAGNADIEAATAALITRRNLTNKGKDLALATENGRRIAREVDERLREIKDFGAG